VIAPFSDLPTMLSRYAAGGLIPLLRPLEWITGFQDWFPNMIVDKWNSSLRLANVARMSKRLRLFIIHARNDWDIPYTNSDVIFAAVANAATPGMDKEVFAERKASNTTHMRDGASISTWTAPGKFVQEIIVAYGGTYYEVWQTK
jgi:abhydrolase domain-containing protein 12